MQLILAFVFTYAKAGFLMMRLKYMYMYMDLFFTIAVGLAVLFSDYNMQYPLTLCLPVSSADNLGKQFEPRSGPTNHRV